MKEGGKKQFARLWSNTKRTLITTFSASNGVAAVLLGDQAAKQKCTIPLFYDRVSKVESGIIASFPYAFPKVSFGRFRSISG